MFPKKGNEGQQYPIKVSMAESRVKVRVRQEIAGKEQPGAAVRKAQAR